MVLYVPCLVVAMYGMVYILWSMKPRIVLWYGGMLYDLTLLRHGQWPHNSPHQVEYFLRHSNFFFSALLSLFALLISIEFAVSSGDLSDGHGFGNRDIKHGIVCMQSSGLDCAV